MTNRLAENFANGKPSFGVLTRGGPGMLDHMARAGVDYVIIDMMFSRVDWDVASHLVRGAANAGMFAFVRIQAYPWVGNQTDQRLVVDAARAVSIGAHGIVVSVRSAEEVAQVAACAGDWHRGVPITSASQLRAHEEQMRENTWVMPILETQQSISEYEEVLNIPGVRAVWPGLTDLSEQLGHPYEYEHPEVVAWLDKVVAKAHEKGIAVCANDGFIYTTPAQKAARLATLRKHGADLLHMQTTDFLAYVSTKMTVDGTLEALSNPSD